MGYAATVASAWAALLLPGWVIAWCAGLRRTDAVLAAAPISLTVLVLTGVSSTHVGLPFTARTTLALAVACAAMSLLAGRLRGPSGAGSARARRDRSAGRADRERNPRATVPLLTLVLLGLTVAAAALIYLQSNEGTLDLPSQTWDAPAHISAIEHAHLTHTADPRGLMAFAYGTSGSFYPPAFTTIGTAAMWAGASNAVIASNVAAILVAGWIWPSCIAILTRAILGRSMVVTSSAVLLAGIGWNMPWAPLGWGVLWPTATGFAIGPMVVAGVAFTLGFGRGLPRSGLFGHWLPRLAVGAPATALAAAVTALGHPRVLVVLTIPALAVALGWALERRRALAGAVRSAPDRRVRRAVLGWALIAAVVLSAGAVARFLLSWASSSQKLVVLHWAPDIAIPTSIGRQLLGEPAESSINVIAAALVVLGLIVGVTAARHRWLVIGWLAAVAADAVTLSNDDRFAGLTRWWYNDHHRITEVIAYFSVPLMSLGVLTAHRWLTNRNGAVDDPAAAERRAAVGARTGSPSAAGPIRLVAVLVAVVVVSAVPTLTYLRERGADYATDPVHGLLSDSESSFLVQVGAIVKADGGGIVLNNPADGSALLYGYTGVPTVFMTSYPGTSTRFGTFLRDTLVTDGNHAVLCQDLAADDVRWVLNMGPTLTDAVIAASPAPGMQIPAGFWATTEVARDGQAVLYRVTGCPAG